MTARVVSTALLGAALLAGPALAERTRVRVDLSGVEIVEHPAADTARRDRVRAAGRGDRHRSEVNESDARVRMFSDIVVGADEWVDGDVVAVLGSVRVAGGVSGSVVAVGGSVAVESGADVGGDAVAVGGGLDLEPGSHVAGESISVGILPVPPGVPTVPLLLGLVAAAWLKTVVLGAVLALIAPRRIIRIGEAVSRRTGLSLLAGIFTLPAVAVAGILLAITVVGIPVAILLPFLYLAAVAFGHSAAVAVLGSRLLRRPLGQGPIVAAIAVGAGFVALFFAGAAILSDPPGLVRTVALFFGVLGALLACGLATVGTGAVLVSRFGSGPRAAAPPLPAAAPAAAPLGGAPTTG